ncbi:hypothetical protein [Glutamicibacter sp. NPDC090743]
MSWSLNRLRLEQKLRRDMPEAVAQAETRDRGHKNLAATSGTVL